MGIITLTFTLMLHTFQRNLKRNTFFDYNDVFLKKRKFSDQMLLHRKYVNSFLKISYVLLYRISSNKCQA